jgi:hypothetical protein
MAPETQVPTILRFGVFEVDVRALERREKVTAELSIRNVNRVVGTILGSEFKDINDNHVGIDINGLISEQSEPARYHIDDGSFRNVSLISGFTPSTGNQFVIMTHGSRTGTFTTTPRAISSASRRIK